MISTILPENEQPASTPVRGGLRLPLNVALILPAQLTLLAVVLIPTLIILWLSVTDWQPTSGKPWYSAEFIGYFNFQDLAFDHRFTAALLRTLLVVFFC